MAASVVPIIAGIVSIIIFTLVQRGIKKAEEIMDVEQLLSEMIAALLARKDEIPDVPDDKTKFCIEEKRANCTQKHRCIEHFVLVQSSFVIENRSRFAISTRGESKDEEGYTRTMTPVFCTNSKKEVLEYLRTPECLQDLQTSFQNLDRWWRD